jgi:hypothetical protein
VTRAQMEEQEQGSDTSLSAAVHAEISETQAGTLSAVARAEAEIKAAIAIAKRFPRNETQARINILKSCDRPRFADEALYAFPRGKGEKATMVEGPSVAMARELARCWGNMQFGLRIVTDDEERVHILGRAYDSETNTLVEMEDKFKKLIQRANGYVRPQERDLRELINRRGAICVRNAILQVIPKDIVEEAVERCNATLTKAAEGKMKEDPKATARKLAEFFDQIGVTVAMLEGHLGHTYDTMTPKEYAKLRGIWQSIMDGNSKVDEYFNAPTRQTAPVDLNAVQVVETGTKAADGSGSKRYVITAEWDGGKGVLTSTKPDHAKLSQEAADTGMLLDATWEESAGVLILSKLARTDEPKDESFKSPPPTSSTGQIDLG